MRITRNPHDPDFTFDFDKFGVTLNGMSVEISDLVWVDDETGELAYFHWDANGEPVANPDSDPIQPIENTASGSIQISAPKSRQGCSGCVLERMKLKPVWFT